MAKESAIQGGSTIKSNQPEFTNYPLRLRKLANFMMNSKVFVSIKQAVEALGLNEQSIWNAISESKKKGNDFTALVVSHFTNKLIRHKNDVGGALVERAVSGSYNHQKLYFQLTGDLKEEANITVNNLTIGINIEGSRPADTLRPKGAIDVNPIIPDDD